MGFSIRTKEDIKIRFQYYLHDAPVTVLAFDKLLPCCFTFYHARFSGNEVWVANAINLNIIQENASVFTLPGEIVLGPSNPARTKTANAIGIYYGEGKGLDAANIFAMVHPEDLLLLQTLGETIWKNGQQEIFFDKMTSL